MLYDRHVQRIDLSLPPASLKRNQKMNAKIMTRFAVFAVAGSLLAGCASQQGTDTAVGTGVGAATGAAIGAIFGGGKGAAIGAGAGAAVGGITGYNWQAIHNKLSGATKGTGTQITEQPDGSLKLNIPSSVTFDTNSYAVKPSFAPVLDQLTQTMQQNPELIAQVIGYTDSTGQPAYNQTLSVNRAESVTGYLGQRGVAPQRLSASGMGQNQPIADNNTEAGRAANRRVEIYLRATAQHATQ
jgi:outer membrane protein OmpA-like peptidoglycan-associated protein